VTETGQKLTRDELLAELKAEHGIDVEDLQLRAARDRQAIKIISAACLHAGRVLRGEEEPDDGD